MTDDYLAVLSASTTQRGLTAQNADLFKEIEN